MAQCAACGSTIIFGGKRHENLRFCNETCLQRGSLQIFAQNIPQDVVQKSVQEIHSGRCPVCNGGGPVDAYASHYVWSAVFMTSWKSKQQISCRSCGIKKQVQGLLCSLFFGWWGFPWGLIMTPVQIFRNLKGIMSTPAHLRPSQQLENLVRLKLAENSAYNLPPVPMKQ